jgi:hypothetical protein
MSGPTLDELFDGVRWSAFRWEGHPAYAVGGAEQERIEAWRRHQPRPERSVRTNAYLARIARGVLDGRTWQRVTVRSDPPTEYQQYRTAGDLESQAAGEEILVVRDNLIGVEDFWLFDYGAESACAAIMRYTPEGAFEGIAVTRDPVTLDEFEGHRRALVGSAVPLNTYLAQVSAERTVA